MKAPRQGPKENIRPSGVHKDHQESITVKQTEEEILEGLIYHFCDECFEDNDES